MLTICPRQFKSRAYREIRSSGHVYLVISLLVALLSTSDLRFVFFRHSSNVRDSYARTNIIFEITGRKHAKLRFSHIKLKFATRVASQVAPAKSGFIIVKSQLSFIYEFPLLILTFPFRETLSRLISSEYPLII